MNDEKTLEEYKAELDALKKSNLEREIEIEKAKLEEASKLEEEKKVTAMKDDMRKEILKEMEGTSKITGETSGDKLAGDDNKWDNFAEAYVKKYEDDGMKHLSYEDACKNLAGEI